MADITSLLPLVNASAGDGVYGATDPSGTPGDALFAVSSLSAYKFLGSIDLSMSTELTTIGDATHKTLIIFIDNMKFSTDNVKPQIRFKKASGIIVTNYRWSYHVANDAPFGADGGSGGLVTEIELSASQGNDTDEAFNAEITILSPSDTTNRKQARFKTWGINLVPQSQLTDGQGIWMGGLDALTAIEFLVNSGTIASGTVRAYGITA